MEDGLRVMVNKNMIICILVLILVLVEDGLRAAMNEINAGGSAVLILVLVEDGLREFYKRYKEDMDRSLNPCSCGGWSQS